MLAHHKHMIETRRLYLFEQVFTRDLPIEARADKSIQFLRELAARVWRTHGRKNLDVPKVQCGSETSHGGLWFSYCDGYGLIVLSRVQRTVAVLLHELAHAMGYGTHGKGFVRKYVQLLVEYGKCDEGELAVALSVCNIKL